MHEYELYGYSLFETLVARKGRFWRLRAHWTRLRKGALALGFPPPSWDEFRDRLARAHDSSQCQVLRYTLLRTGGAWSFEPTLAQRTVVLAKPYVPAAAAVRLSTAKRRLPVGDPARCFKTGSRLLLQLAFSEARQAGFDDCLLLDDQDRILETSMANIYAYLDGTWVTPAERLGLLAGVCRQWVMRRAGVAEAHFTSADLRRARGVAVSNAVTGLRPVAAIDDCRYDLTLAKELAARCGRRRFQAL